MAPYVRKVGKRVIHRRVNRVTVVVRIRREKDDTAIPSWQSETSVRYNTGSPQMRSALCRGVQSAMEREREKVEKVEGIRIECPVCSRTMAISRYGLLSPTYRAQCLCGICTPAYRSEYELRKEHDQWKVGIRRTLDPHNTGARP